MKIGQQEISKSTAIIAAIAIVALIALVWVAWPSKAPISTQATINEVKAQLEAQFNKQLEEKDIQIKDYKSRLVVSDGKYKVLVKKYADLQKEKENVKLPVTNAELRDRFTALGYPPLPLK